MPEISPLDNEDQRRRGRAETFVLMMAQAAFDYSNAIQGRPTGQVSATESPLPHFDELIRVAGENPAFASVQQLAAQGKMIATVIMSQTVITGPALLELLSGAQNVEASLRRGLIFLQAHRAAESQVARLQRQSTEPQYTMDQLIKLGDQSIEREKLRRDGIAKMADSAIIFAGATIKALLALNGGAAVALLAFIGHLVTTDTSHGMNILPRSLAPSLLTFSFGALCGGAVAVLAYLAQMAYRSDLDAEHSRWHNVGECLRWIAIATAILGFLLFACGVRSAAVIFSAV